MDWTFSVFSICKILKALGKMKSCRGHGWIENFKQEPWGTSGEVEGKEIEKEHQREKTRRAESPGRMYFKEESDHLCQMLLKVE